MGSQAWSRSGRIWAERSPCGDFLLTLCASHSDKHSPATLEEDIVVSRRRGRAVAPLRSGCSQSPGTLGLVIFSRPY